MVRPSPPRAQLWTGFCHVPVWDTLLHLVSGAVQNLQSVALKSSAVEFEDRFSFWPFIYYISYYKWIKTIHNSFLQTIFYVGIIDSWDKGSIVQQTQPPRWSHLLSRGIWLWPGNLFQGVDQGRCWSFFVMPLIYLVLFFSLFLLKTKWWVSAHPGACLWGHLSPQLPTPTCFWSGCCVWFHWSAAVLGQGVCYFIYFPHSNYHPKQWYDAPSRTLSSLRLLSDIPANMDASC